MLPVWVLVFIFLHISSIVPCIKRTNFSILLFPCLFYIRFIFRPSNVLTVLKLKGRKATGLSNTNTNASPRFSEIVSVGGAGTLVSGGKKVGATGVQKKLQQKMSKNHQQASNNTQGAGDFKIGQVTSDLPLSPCLHMLHSYCLYQPQNPVSAFIHVFPLPFVPYSYEFTPSLAICYIIH